MRNVPPSQNMRQQPRQEEVNPTPQEDDTLPQTSQAHSKSYYIINRNKGKRL